MDPIVNVSVAQQQQEVAQLDLPVPAQAVTQSSVLLPTVVHPDQPVAPFLSWEILLNVSAVNIIFNKPFNIRIVLGKNMLS